VDGLGGRRDHFEGRFGGTPADGGAVGIGVERHKVPPEQVLEVHVPPTPFDMVVLNDLDRFHPVNDVIDRVPGLAAHAAYTKQTLRDKLIERRQYITLHGEDMPEVREWAWRY